MRTMNWEVIGNISYRRAVEDARATKKRLSKEQARWRFLCLQRDGYQCLLCGSSGPLEVHHIQRWVDAPLLRFKKSNGATLCRECHQKGHGGNGQVFSEDTMKALLRAMSRPKSQAVL